MQPAGPGRNMATWCRLRLSVAGVRNVDNMQSVARPRSIEKRLYYQILKHSLRALVPVKTPTNIIHPKYHQAFRPGGISTAVVYVGTLFSGYVFSGII